MRALVQRVAGAEVEVDGRVVGRAGKGLLVFLGVARADTPEYARRLAEKCARLRVFVDADGKMNRSLLDQKNDASPAPGAPPAPDSSDAVDSPPADVLVISQFTLYADTRQGHRPGFSDAAPGPVAEPLYDYFCGELSRLGLTVARGVFGASMDVSLVNQGPVTLLLEYPVQ